MTIYTIFYKGRPVGTITTDDVFKALHLVHDASIRTGLAFTFGRFNRVMR